MRGWYWDHCILQATWMVWRLGSSRRAPPLHWDIGIIPGEAFDHRIVDTFRGPDASGRPQVPFR